MPRKKTLVLVPGTWLGAWAWRRVVPLLERTGNAPGTRIFNVNAGEIRLTHPGQNALAFKTTWKGP